jgi:hypothetical protein
VVLPVVVGTLSIESVGRFVTAGCHLQVEEFNCAAVLASVTAQQLYYAKSRGVGHSDDVTEDGIEALLRGAGCSNLFGAARMMLPPALCMCAADSVQWGVVSWVCMPPDAGSRSRCK